MTPLEFALLVVAGFFTGVVGFVTGLASIVSYPALLAAGLSPVSANVTNTVSLVAVGVGALSNSSRELTRRGRTLGRLTAYSALGGLVGAGILLIAPAESFETAVPFLVAAASVALLFAPRVRRLVGDSQFPRLVPFAVFLISIYGGYFGAGAGVIFLSVILLFTAETVWAATVLKSFLLGVANLVAAVGFALVGPVHWTAALALGLGALVGGWCGPPVVRLIPPAVLRIGVAICGIGLAGWLALK